MVAFLGLWNFITVKCNTCGLLYSRNAELVEKNPESICGRCAAREKTARKL